MILDEESEAESASEEIEEKKSAGTTDTGPVEQEHSMIDPIGDTKAIIKQIDEDSANQNIQ